MNRNKMVIIFISVLWLVLSAIPRSSALAGDVSGSWYMVANGKTYILRLTQRGEKIYGMLIPTNNNHRLDSFLEGTIRENRLVFICRNRESSIILKFRGVLTSGKNNETMFGTYRSNTRRSLKWYAIKY